MVNKTWLKSVFSSAASAQSSAARVQPRCFLENVRNKGTLQTFASSQMEEVELATVQKRQKDTEYFYSVF